MQFLTEPLNGTHHREGFSCGKDSLDNYIKTQAGQYVKRKLSVCFVLVSKEEVIGYYTLSNGGIPR